MSLRNRTRLSRELAIAAALAAALAGPALAGNAAGGNLGVGTPAPAAGVAGGAPAGNPNAEGVRTPGTPPTILGRVTRFDLASRTLFLDNGENYVVGANVEVGTLTAGQAVTLTLDAVGGAKPTISKITPAN